MKCRVTIIGIWLIFICLGKTSGAVFTAIASNGWTNTLTWSHVGGVAADADNIPDANDDVTIGAFTVTAPNGITMQVQSLTIQNGGTLSMNAVSSVLDIFPAAGFLTVNLG